MFHCACDEVKTIHLCHHQRIKEEIGQRDAITIEQAKVNASRVNARAGDVAEQIGRL
jgi:hypothetical protein